VGNVVEVTDASFQREVVDSEMPVLVDFWAPWCGPCKMIAPILDDLAQTHESQVKVCKVNVDNCPEISGKFAVRSIPTLIIFKGGEAVATHIGMARKPELLALIDQHVAG